MMPLQSFELRDHRVAGRDQRARTVWKSIRQEGLDKAGVGKSLLRPVIRSGGDQVANHLGGMLDAIEWNGAAMCIAEQEAGCLGKVSGAGGLGSADTKEEHRRHSDNKSWTHGNLPIQYVPLE